MTISPTLSRSFRRFVVHPLEASAAFLFFYLFKALPLDWASGLGGLLGGLVGPWLPVTERAHHNLRQIFPEMGAAERRRLVKAMWRHLGRVAGEFPHLGKFRPYAGDGRIEVRGAEILDRIRDCGHPALFFSGHIGNWEMLPLSTIQRGIELDFVYRVANNRLVEWLYRSGRGRMGGGLVPKGASGARQLLKALHSGRSIGMLVDQKMNDGIPVRFFGRDAMTASALADLARRFDHPIVPIRVERLGGATFRITVEPPLEVAKTGDKHADILAVMTQVNAVLERWIRERPAQWLWLHNRWPD